MFISGAFYMKTGHAIALSGNGRIRWENNMTKKTIKKIKIYKTLIWAVRSKIKNNKTE